MRGFRCNLVYTRAASRLNVVPMFASRIQALRSGPLCLLYNVDNKFMHACNVIAFYVLYTKIHIPKKLQYQRKIKREKFPVMFVIFRYLSIIWGIDLSKVAVFVGEKGDTDYEDLLAGLHKTIILRGSVEHGSEKLLRSEDSFKREDVVPQDSPNITFIEESYEAHDISAALEAVGIK